MKTSQSLREAAPSAPPCCGSQRLRWRGAGRASSWLLPGVLLAAMPKCPVCLAAYIALLTGISFPAGTASILLNAVMAVCVGLLFIPLSRLLRRSGSR